MSSREYFSLRYAVPGFSFILIIVGLNFLPMYDILKALGTTEILAIILSFLSLFTGSAIGFLFTQIWFWRYHSKRIYAPILKHLEKPMIENLGWRPGEYTEDKEVAMSAILDYILCDEKENKFWQYGQRRWDIYHILSCTKVSLLIGYCVGYIFRIIWLILFRNDLINSPIFIVKNDLILIILTSIFVSIFYLVISNERGQIFNEYYKMLEILLTKKRSDICLIKRLIDVFPAYFEKTNPMT